MRVSPGTDGSLVAVLISFPFVFQARAFVEVPYNTTQYFGPDGPWQAVHINVSYRGQEPQTINLYPALLWGGAALYAPDTNACEGSTSGDCRLGGTIPPLPSNRSEPIYYGLPFSDPTIYGYSLEYSGDTTYMTVLLENGIYFNQATVGVCDTAAITYPNGAQIATSVGLVGVGGNFINIHTDAAGAFVNYLAADSDAYSLHIGATTFEYPGSFIFGGYDRGRVIGPVIEYHPYSLLRLLDIVLDVEVGDSPFDFGSKTGLLSSGPTISEPLATFVAPHLPYIFLPSDSVEAITKLLPVKFAPSTSYYLWDTSDERYRKIMSSAGYLGFVFPSTSGSAGNVTIKVPFALLNLTLDKAISGLSEDAPYLPIMASDADFFPFTQDSASCLGRAFLQAALMGTNWGQNVSWLAQAPGPGTALQGLGYDPVDLQSDATVLEVRTGEEDFKRSWEGHWTPLGKKAKSPGTTKPGPKLQKGSGSGLGGGAIAGIVIGVIAAIVVVAGVIFVMLRRKKKQQAPPQYTAPGKETSQGMDELDSLTYRHEAADREKGELPAGVPRELEGRRLGPQELPTNNQIK